MYFWSASLISSQHVLTAPPRAHAHTLTLTLNKSLWKTSCLLCSVSFFAFPLFFHQFWENIIYFKISFQKRLFLENYPEDSKNCWGGTDNYLWVARSDLLLWTRPCEWDATATGRVQNHRIVTFRSRKGPERASHPLTSFPRWNEDKIDGKSCPKSHTDDIQISIVFQKYHMVANGAFFLFCFELEDNSSNIY